MGEDLGKDGVKPVGKAWTDIRIIPEHKTLRIQA